LKVCLDSNTVSVSVKYEVINEHKPNKAMVVFLTMMETTYFILCTYSKKFEITFYKYFQFK